MTGVEAIQARLGLPGENIPSMRRFALATVALLLLPVASAGTAQAAVADPVAAYSLVAPVGASPSGLVARAIMPLGVGCPRLQVVKSDGSRMSVAMTQRAAPATTGAAFTSLTSCTADIPAGAASAHVGTATIPAAMPATVKRMAIFGDSGCRLKGSSIQDCGDPSEWPLARITNSIAKEQPDLIVFTGDFFYREAGCPDSDLAKCGGSPAPIKGMPFNDSAYSWSADVFTPMSPMFPVAPIVVTRGNHEACYRGGNGYFIYMDPRKGTEGNCAPFTDADGTLTVPSNDLDPTYAADIPLAGGRSLRLVVVDSAYGQDCEPSNIVPLQRTRYERAQQLAKGRESWLVVHRPITGWQPNTDCGPTGGWISADQAVASAGLLSPFEMLLSSHVHIAEAVNIEGLPPQLVIGNGGTKLEDPAGMAPIGGPSFAGATYSAPTSFWSALRFGYVMATPAPGTGWTMQMHDPTGGVFATCALKAQQIACEER